MGDGADGVSAKAQARPFDRTRPRPLSPHVTIYRWPITMAASIAHRATGTALAGGTLFLAWWLVAAATGPDAYAVFMGFAASVLGRLILFGFVLSLAFHLLNGIRHLAWDIGLGYAVPTAKLTAAIAFGLAVVIALGVFALGYFPAGGGA